MATAQQIDAVKKQMADLGQQWHQTNDPTKQKQISDTSLQLGTSIGAKRNESAGTWDYSGVKADPVDYAAQAQTQIGAMMEAERAARLQALRAQQQKATGQLNQQKAEVQPQYYAKKNEADANMAQNVQRLREVMASNGLSGNTAGSGENITANVAQNAARQNVLGDLNLQEQQTLNDFNRRIADVNDPSQEMQIEAALNAEKARMLYDAQNRAQDLQFRDSQFDYQKQRDQVGDTRWQTEFDYKKNFDQKQFDEDVRRFGVQQAMQLAGITGFYDGKPTFAREQFNSDNAFKQQQLAQQAANAAMRSSGGGSSGGGSGGVGAGSGMSAAQIKELQADSGAMLGKLQSGELSVEKAIETINAARTIYGDAYANGLNSVLNQYTNNQVSKVRTSDSNELAKRGRSGGGSQSNYQSYVTPEAADLASRYLGQ